MSDYTKFDSECYSEELYPVSEAEHDEVQAMIASENFIVRDGKVYHKPEPPSLGRLGGIEL